MTALVAASLLVSHAEAEDCFTKSDNDRLLYRVFQVARPPQSLPERNRQSLTDPFYPASDYATTSVRETSRPSNYNVYYFLWANHCSFVPGSTPSTNECREPNRTKGNGYDGMELGPIATQVRANFSTYAKANGCTIIQAKSVMGSRTEELEGDAMRAGLAVFTGEPKRERMSNLARDVTFANGKSSRALVDVCVLPRSVPSAALKGFMLDYEVWDGRTPAEVIQFVSELRDTAHRNGLELLVSTNPLPREPSGLTAENVRQVLAVVDGLLPAISTGASPGHADIDLSPRERKTSPMASYREQLAVLEPAGTQSLSPKLKRKLFWTVSLYDLSLAEASQIQALTIQEGYGGIMLFRNYVREGGECSRDVNQNIACLAIGVCTGLFKR